MSESLKTIAYYFGFELQTRDYPRRTVAEGKRVKEVPVYFNASDCEDLAEAFDELAQELRTRTKLIRERQKNLDELSQVTQEFVGPDTEKGDSDT